MWLAIIVGFCWVAVLVWAAALWVRNLRLDGDEDREHYLMAEYRPRQE